MFVFVLRALGVVSCVLALSCGSPTRLTSLDSAPPSFFPSEGASFHYRLDLPQGSGPFPAVVVAMVRVEPPWTKAPSTFPF